MAKLTDDDIAEINQAIYEECRDTFSRRGLLVRGATIGAGSMIALNLFGCKQRTDVAGGLSATQAASPIATELQAAGVTFQDFYKDQDAVDAHFPTVMKKYGTQDPKIAMKIFGGMIGGVIKGWLDSNPYGDGTPGNGMFPQLFAQRATRPIAQSRAAIPHPQLGKIIPWPIVVFQQKDVLSGLLNTDTFTVDPYAPAMEAATSGSQYPLKRDAAKTYTQRPTLSKSNPKKVEPKSGYYQHYMLGTDNDDAYEADSILSRISMRQSDIPFLKKEIRKACEGLVKNIKKGDTFDAVQTICRYAPILVVQNHIGLPSYPKKGQGADNPQFDIGGLKAGDKFPIEKDLLERYTFKKIGRNSDMAFEPISGTTGVVPTREEVYLWVKAAFRNTFNNFGNPNDPAVVSVREAGLAATQNLLAWSSKVINHYQKLIEGGATLGSKSVPINMFTRLLEMQQQVQSKSGFDSLAKQFPEIKKIGIEEIRRRLTNDRVQILSFGVFVGAVANPEEANARILDGILRLKEKRINPVKGSPSNINTYAHAAQLANAKSDKADSDLQDYAVELLRLQPQGEILLRKAIRPSKIGGLSIPPNTTVFFAHGAAMRDDQGANLKEPLAFNYKREDGRRTTKYRYGIDQRSQEKPQSKMYLHHGYGRHKCLGRYASEVTMVEVLRAVLRLGEITRAAQGGELKMDANGLYADSMMLSVK